MRELHEVAADADALRVELTRANRLPANFPTEQLQTLLTGLCSLPLGTAEGCRQPLEYARARLPALRRQFIQTEQQSVLNRADADTPPPLIRGMLIDLRIGALVNSVTTALDEYRALASVEDDGSADTSLSIEIDTAAPDAVDAIVGAQKAEHALNKQIDKLDGLANSDSITADNLKRQMRDTRGLFSLARVEMRMPAFVPRWFEKTILAISDYPRILLGTISAVQMGVDIARPLVDAWHQFEHHFSTSILDSIDFALQGLSAVGRKWDADRNVQKGASSAKSSDQQIFDINVVIEMIVRGESPPSIWRPRIKDLVLIGKPVRSLKPLSKLTALESLDLSGTPVSDIAQLSGLIALQRLILHDTQVEDLSPLADLTNLTYISVDHLRIDQNITLNVAEIHAKGADIAGAMTGRLVVPGNLIVRSTGNLDGVAACRRLQIEDGGHITGKIEMLTEKGSP